MKYAMPPIDHKVPLLLAVVAACLWLPAFVTVPHTIGDAVYHLVWEKAFAEQLWGGDLYPRYLFAMNQGEGAPTFYVYPPLAYYITAIFYPLHWLDGGTGWFALLVSGGLATWFCGVGAWKWFQAMGVSRALAIWGGLIYMAFPYRLVIDGWMAMNFAQLWGAAWIPWLLWAAKRLCVEKGAVSIPLAVIWAAVVLTHVPTAFLCGLGILGWVVLLAVQCKWRLFGRCVASIAAGSLLAAIYWLPMLEYRSLLSLHEMLEGRLDYTQNFLSFSDFADPVHYIRQPVAWLNLVCGLLIFTVVAVESRGFRRMPNRPIAVAAIAGGLAIAMMYPIAKLVWDWVPVLQALQFSWRFHLLVTPAVAELMVLAAQRHGFQPSLQLWGVVLCALPILFMVGWLSHYPHHGWQGMSNADAQAMVDCRAVPSSEHRPNWVAPEEYHGLWQFCLPEVGADRAVTGWYFPMMMRCERPGQMLCRSAYSKEELLGAGLSLLGLLILLIHRSRSPFDFFNKSA